MEVLNQLKLPLESVYENVSTIQEGWEQIRLMKIRGAPAIAIAGCLAVGVEVHQRVFAGDGSDFKNPKELVDFICESLEFMLTSRPTAVNLQNAVRELTSSVKADIVASNPVRSVNDIASNFLDAVEGMLESDRADNRAIGDACLKLFEDNGQTKYLTILTHCNTGSLATAGFGTALGCIRALHSRGMLHHAYCTETRPYNQGSRLTAYELLYENIPSTLITDSMAGSLMHQKTKTISAVIVGADRVAANGDTANKIGTYSLAVLAKHHGIPFYVAAPTTSFDFQTISGDDIVVEERSSREVIFVGETVQLAPAEMNVWNPAFDITPIALIAGFFTEKGFVRTPEDLRK
jgi:methylthioribose-1-phosphate isomerase